jgi:hypothetical protein
MRLVIGIVFICIGLLHALHVLDLSGPVTNLNGGKFFSFSNLDRIASSGFWGKYFVLMIDVAIIGFGVQELIWKIKK